MVILSVGLLFSAAIIFYGIAVIYYQMSLGGLRRLSRITTGQAYIIGFFAMITGAIMFLSFLTFNIRLIPYVFVFFLTVHIVILSIRPQD